MSNSELINQSLQQTIADFSKATPLTPELIKDRRARICDLEDAMKSLPNSYDMKQGNEGKVKHHFGSKVYGRELFIPASNIIVSKIHRGRTINVITEGFISVICPHNGYNTYEAPHIFVSEPYTKRIVISHEDTTWFTAHGNPDNIEDLEELEEVIIAKSFDDLMQIEKQRG